MSSLGGKLGIWTVLYDNGQFKDTSTSFPTMIRHIDVYKALVRNSEGSLEIIVNLYVYGNYQIIVFYRYLTMCAVV